MTPPRSPRGGAVLAGLFLVALGHAASAQSTAGVPRGTLTVDRDYVRVGQHSELDWKIEYPSVITDLVDIVPPQRIVPKRDVRMKVRVLGVAFQSGRSLLPLDAYWSRNGGSWQRFFYGTGPDVDPGEVLVSRKVSKGEFLDFGARGWNRSWLPFHHTRYHDPYVTVLKNGDSAPDYAPAYDQGDIESFLGPYIDARGRVRIGERDLIVLWEASTSRPGSYYFDMQDLVVLLTFE